MIFRNFLIFFWEFSCPGRVRTEFGIKIFFSFFRPLSFPFSLKIMSERGFVIFWIFLLFFSEFSCRVECKRNSGLKFFSRFLNLPHQALAKNNAGKRFYNFLNFLTIDFWIFLLGSSMNGIRYWNFFLFYLAYLIPFWLKIMPGRGFIIFQIFLLFFSEFSYPGRVWTEFGTKFFFFFFGLSYPVLVINNGEKWFYNFLNFFITFFGIFLPRSSMNGIWE